MGNQLAPAAQTSAGQFQDYQKLQEEFGNFQLLGQLGGGRFLKSFTVNHEEGLFIMKVYTKREPPVSLGRMHEELEQIRDKFARNWPLCCNVAAFMRIVETTRAGYLLRQHVHSSLLERISSRPFLHKIEKKWLAFQMLQALVQGEACGICHGDIKPENVLLTSWDWVLLSDFANFKPRHLPDGNSADYSFYFDTPGKGGRAGRRICYIAPERFYHEATGRGAPLTPLQPVAAPPEPAPVPAPAPIAAAELSGFTVPGASPAAGSGSAAPVESIPLPSKRAATAASNGAADDGWHPGEGELLPSMDIFSIGCVIAELFLPRLEATFSYSELLSYRSGDFDLDNRLSAIEDEAVRQMVRSMLDIDPSTRRTAMEYATDTPSVFPAYFGDFLHRFLAKLLRADHDEKINIIAVAEAEITEKLAGETAVDTDPAESGMMIIMSVLTTSLPHASMPWLKVHALQMLGRMSHYVDDDVRLQRLVPHILSVSVDPVPIVRAACIAAATEVLALVREVPGMDGFLFMEYILPAFADYATHEDIEIRIAFANNAPTLANAALTFHRARWDRKESEKAKSDGSLSPAMNVPDMSVAGFLEAAEDNEDDELRKLRAEFRKLFLPLLTDQNPEVQSLLRRAILSHSLHLATFFGETMSEELLPHIMSSLNDRDWLVSAAFFDNITTIAVVIAKTPAQRKEFVDFVLPCILQALSEFEQSVIEHALNALAVLYDLDLLEKSKSLEVLQVNVTVMLCHPTLAVRAGSVACVLGAAKQLSMAEVHCRLLPILRPFLKTGDIVDITEETLLEELRPPLSQDEYSRIVDSMDTETAGQILRLLDTVAEDVAAKYAPGATEEMKMQADRKVADAFREHDPQGLLELEDREKMVLMRRYIGDSHARAQTTFAMMLSENNERLAGGEMGGEMTPYYKLSQTIPAYRRPIMEQEGLENPPPLSGSYVEGRTRIAAAAQPPDAVEGPDGELAAGHNEDAKARVPAAAWGSEELRMYEVAPGVTGVSGSGSNGNGMLGTVDDYVVAGGGRHEDEMGQQTHGILDPSFNTWRPAGVLCAHLHEHMGAINAFRVAADNSHLISASDDGTVKVWNSSHWSHLETPTCDDWDDMCLAEATVTYTGQSGRILDIAPYGGASNQWASASDDGSIHCMALVDGGVAKMKYWSSGEGSITKLATIPNDPHLLVYATQGGAIHCHDSRSPTEAWCCGRLEEMGLTTGLVVGSGSEWIAAASSRGFVNIWDTRFQLKVDTWRHPSGSPIYAMAPASMDGRAGWQGRMPACVALATAGEEVSIWDLSHQYTSEEPYTNERRATLSAGMEPPMQSVGLNPPGKATFADDGELSAGDSAYQQHACAMLTSHGKDGNFMITAGTASRIRYWDLRIPASSYYVGPTGRLPDRSHAAIHADGSMTKADVTEEVQGLHHRLSWMDQIMPSAQGGGAGTGDEKLKPTQCHLDGISAMETLLTPQALSTGPVRVLITGSRDGVIKMWR